MDLFITLLMGIGLGAYGSKVLYDWKVLDKARTGQRLELHGSLYRIEEDVPCTPDQ